MRLLHTVTPDEWSAYRAELVRMNLGWVIFKTPSSFRPVHRVLMHPEDGPVIQVMDEIFEIDVETTEVFANEELAMVAHYSR